MNAPVIDRGRLKRAASAIEQQYGLTVQGILPDGTVNHPSGRDPVVLLAVAPEDFSLFDLCSAEVELEDALSAPARIILESELHGKRKSVASRSRPL
ncbi:MAG TPA: hypothetical protein VF744_02695 [Beijerinckiaceae bacterium]|jgi:hypothetical protein